MTRRYAARVDANQAAIVKQLRAIPGVSVAMTHDVGKGFADLVIGFRRRNYLIELKDANKPPSARKLTPDEEKFMAAWHGQYAVCKTIEEIIDVLNFTKGEG